MNSRFGKTAALPALVFCLLLFTFSARAALKSAPLTTGGSMNGMVRVRLASLGSPSSLQLTVYGSYTVNGQRTLANASSVTVRCSGGRLTLTSGGVTSDMGTAFRLRRHAASGSNGIKIAQSRVPGNLYPGDFTFTAQGNSLSVVASIYIEDYLYGVLPYEMGDSTGMEALKAQAVAARTYTMRAMQSRTWSSYDVVDTTGDQVYNGTPSGCVNCKRAVDATKGIVAKNGSSLTATYYTASNGGQTESIKNAWGTSGYAYLTVKDDPYDLRNALSPHRSFTVNKSGKQSNAALNSLLSQKAAAVFSPDAVITAVTDVSAHSPQYAAPSALNTKLTFAVKYTAKGKSWTGMLTFDIFNELEKPLNMSINTLKNELWSVEKTASSYIVSARRYGHGIGMSQRGAMQMAQEGCTYDQILAFYYEGCARAQYTLSRSILSAVVPGQESQEQVIDEQPADVSPTPGKNVQRAQVTTPQGSLNLRMDSSTESVVLRTIPQGAYVSVLESGKSWCTVSYDGTTGHVMTQFLTFEKKATATPAKTPKATKTPKPTATPKAAKATAKPTKTPKPTATPAPSPTPLPQSSGAAARVVTPKGSLNLRKFAQDNAKILCTVPQNATVTVLRKNVKWTRVTYEGVTGYVMTRFLSFSEPENTQKPGKTAKPMATKAPAKATPTPRASSAPASGIQAKVTTKNGGSLHLRKIKNDSAQILASIPNGTALEILSKGSVWCKTTFDGKTGYVMTRFLAFPGSAQASAPRKTAAPQKEELKPLKTAVTGQIVCKNGKKLNLRASCLPDARVLYQMPNKEYLTITAVSETWCAVEYKNKKGYCMKEYLEYTLYEQ